MKKIIKNNFGELVAFFLTIIVLFFTFYIVGIIEHGILISDLKYEFYPFYTHFIKFISGKVGLYSFNLGMGDSFLGALYFYMSSPFNLLLLIIKNINLFCIITVILKSALSSLFCYKYL